MENLFNQQKLDREAAFVQAAKDKKHELLVIEATTRSYNAQCKLSKAVSMAASRAESVPPPPQPAPAVLPPAPAAEPAAVSAVSVAPAGPAARSVEAAEPVAEEVAEVAGAGGVNLAEAPAPSVSEEQAEQAEQAEIDVRASFMVLRSLQSDLNEIQMIGMINGDSTWNGICRALEEIWHTATIYARPAAPLYDLQRLGKYENLPISIDDGVDKCHEFMENAQKTLDDAVYGLNDAKMQIMQMLGQLLTNPKSIGTAIAIHGPPGTGKTSLVKEGISKILNRPFAFIALGGATDSSFLEGHGYTYEGSTWGKIVQILIDSKCMNPVIYFDELDKISDTPRGEEIAGILTHLTDTTQNNQFHDKYFAEINFDLSKCLFIFSYNDESKVNPILKDRMYRIQTKGYNQKQKTVIGKNYLLPKIQEQVRFDEKEIIIPDETIHYIIENHCNKEDGVRNLKRCFEIIYTKLNLYRLMKPGSNLFEEDMSLKVEFPFTVTMEIVDKLIKIDKGNVSALYSMYV